MIPYWCCIHQVYDLEGICNRLIQSDDRLAPMKRCMLILTYDADARGGEVKFLRYDTMYWDPKFECLVVRWREIKTLKEYLMPFTSSPFGPELDVYHSFGCFYIQQNGLARGVMPEDKARGKFVFPYLHEKMDKYVASLITSTIKQHISPGIKDYVTSKSLRRGASTMLSLARDVSFPEVLARSGHSSGTNVDHYVISTLAASLPGSRSLPGWKYPRECVYPPRLECLGTHSQDDVEKTMELLFAIGVPEFKQQQKLRPMLRTCMATHIMYYTVFRMRYGASHMATESLEHAVERAKDVTAIEARNQLKAWSTTIWDDFATRNAHQLGDEARTGALHDDVSKLMSMVGSLTKKVGELTTQVMHQHELNMQLVAQNSDLQEQNNGLQVQYSELRDQNDMILRILQHMAGNDFPPASLTPVPVPQTQKAVTPASASNKRLSLAPQARLGAPKKQRVTNLNDVLRYSSTKAETMSKGVLISELIRQLHADRKITKNTKLQNTVILNVKDPAKYKRTMRFVDKIWTQEDREILANPNVSPNTLAAVTKAIDMRCLIELNHLEKKPEKPTSRQKAYYMGVALRLQSLGID